MQIGFTGAQKGMSFRQKKALDKILYKLDPLILIHGGCHGADTQAEHIARNYEIATRILPGSEDQYSKWEKQNHPNVWLPIPYLKRNKNIVDSCSILIAAPRVLKEAVRSGTWSTIRYARKQRKPILILDP